MTTTMRRLDVQCALAALACVIVAPEPALADTVPAILYACDDPNVLQRIEDNATSAARQGLTPGEFVALSGSREILTGAPPAGANTHATATTYVALSRYCEGSAAFAGGEPEPVYWRIDLVKNEDEQEVRFEVCARWFDMFEDGCSAYRASQEGRIEE